MNERVYSLGTIGGLEYTPAKLQIRPEILSRRFLPEFSHTFFY